MIAEGYNDKQYVIAETPPHPYNNVTRPAHYLEGGLEVEQICFAKLTKEEYIGACKWNIYKYTMRAGKKHDNALEDYKKALWYMEKLVERMEKEQ